MSDTSEKKLSRNEHIKADSHGLRGGIARGLGEVITGQLDEDDSDVRAERGRKKMEKAFSLWPACGCLAGR